MSKNRPSAAIRRTERKGSANEKDLGYWRRRVFKNSYTYKGRLARVSSWSVKLQHCGERRTISLRSSGKGDAAQEAQALYEKVVKDGWGTIDDNARETIQTGVRFWQQRLVRRPYHDPTAASSTAGLSARIVHDGSAWYFPLGSNDDRIAAERANEIHNMVIRKGWAAANAAFSRELAIAIHWSANPLVWTYATLHTQIGPHSVAQAVVPPNASGHTRVALIEPDAGVRQAFAYYINRHPGLHCSATFGSATDAFGGIRRSEPHIALVNHHLPDMEGPQCVPRVNALVPECSCLLFSVYEDSGELFKSTTAGSAGYLLKRTAPDQILAPISGLPSAELSTRQITHRVWKYFQQVVSLLQNGDPNVEMQKLSPRECEVLDCLSRGYVDKEIAGALGISGWTVHGHLKKIFEKLGVHSRTEAVVKYLQR